MRRTGRNCESLGGSAICPRCRAPVADMRNRLEIAEALFAAPMPDLGTLQEEIRKCKDALDETQFDKTIFVVLIAVLAGLVLILAASGILVLQTVLTRTHVSV